MGKGHGPRCSTLPQAGTCREDWGRALQVENCGGCLTHHDGTIYVNHGWLYSASSQIEVFAFLWCFFYTKLGTNGISKRDGASSGTRRTFYERRRASMREGGLSRSRGGFFFGLCFLLLKAYFVFYERRRAVKIARWFFLWIVFPPSQGLFRLCLTRLELGYPAGAFAQCPSDLPPFLSRPYLSLLDSI